MPFAQWLLVNIPAVLLGALIVVASIVISVTSLFVVRRCIEPERFKVHNDVAGAIFGTLGMAYTVLLAFVVVVVWQDFDKTGNNVEREANCVIDLHDAAQVFAPAIREPLRVALKEYAHTVMREEWPMLAVSQESGRARRSIRRIGELYASYLPQGPTDTVYFSLSVEKFNELCELRRERLYAAGCGIHPVFWFVLIAGGIATITFTIFFGSENPGAHILMTILLSAVIGLIIFTILVFDYPFSGGMAISSGAFGRLLAY